MPEPVVYYPANRPDVEVLVDGSWYPGELRAWFPSGEGTWTGNVQYSLQVAENRLDTFSEDQIRKVVVTDGGPLPDS